MPSQEHHGWVKTYYLDDGLLNLEIKIFDEINREEK